MLRDSRIVHIIDLLGELRELLLVIDQAGDTAPAILLKLAKEKAEEITRLTRELHIGQDNDTRRCDSKHGKSPRKSRRTRIFSHHRRKHNPHRKAIRRIR